MSADNGQLLDVRSAAIFLGLSQDAIRARISRRVLPFRRLGGRIVFLRTELERFIAELPGVNVDEALQGIAKRREAEQ